MTETWRERDNLPTDLVSEGYRRFRRFRLFRLCLLLAALFTVLVFGWAPPFAGAASSPSPFGWPTGLAVTGGDLWVVNADGNSLTEISTHTGSVIRIIDSPAYGFKSPDSIATNGTSLWVANSEGRSLTQVEAKNGALMRVIKPNRDRLDYPGGVVYADGEVWVASGGNVDHNASIFELSPATGKVVRILTKGMYSAVGLSVIGRNVWVGNANDTVTEFSATSGALERVINLKGLGTGIEAVGFVSHNDNVWLANGASTEPGTNYSMVELRSSDGSVIRERNASLLRIDTYQANPSALSTDGKNIWIATRTKIVVMSASNGKFEKVIQHNGTNGISYADDLLISGRTLWIANGTGGGSQGSITELSLPNGQLVRVIQ